MKTMQFTYPFSNPLSFNLSNVTYFQIGIEEPQSLPLDLVFTEEVSTYPIAATINDTDYFINTNDILEFSDLNRKSLNITIQNLTNPYLIVDIAYEADE